MDVTGCSDGGGVWTIGRADGHGERAVLATAAVKAGARLWSELPLAAQVDEQRTLLRPMLCAHCLVFCGSWEDLVRPLAERFVAFEGGGDAEALVAAATNLPAAVYPFLPPAVCCPATVCSERYCSERCRDVAAALYHSPDVCARGGEARVAKWVEGEARMHEDMGLTCAALVLAMSTREPGRLAIAAMHGESMAAVAFEHAGCSLTPEAKQAFVEQSLLPLRTRLLDLLGMDEAPPAATTADEWDQLLGMLRCNVRQIEFASPLDAVAHACDAHAAEPGVDVFLAWAAKVRAAGESGRTFPSVHGIGLFPRYASINHSCRPNAGPRPLDKLHEGPAQADHAHPASLFALRDIAAGEEICTAYVDVSLPRAERQHQLWAGYRFRCTCARCNEEGQDEQG